jgi:hypothetical protein
MGEEGKIGTLVSNELRAIEIGGEEVGLDPGHENLRVFSKELHHGCRAAPGCPGHEKIRLSHRAHSSPKLAEIRRDIVKGNCYFDKLEMFNGTLRNEVF